MTLHEALDRHDLTSATTITAEPSPDRFIRMPRLGNLAEVAGMILAGLLLVAWTVGAYAGIVYWSIQGSLGGVILSVIVPGFGAASTLPLYLGLGSGG